MTNELEKQFFDTFGIEPIEIPSREYDSDGEICSYYVEYPQITDSIYLELVALLNTSTSKRLYVEDVEDLKAQTLKGLIACYYEMGAALGGCSFVELQNILAFNIRTLFEEER